MRKPFHDRLERVEVQTSEPYKYCHDGDLWKYHSHWHVIGVDDNKKSMFLIALFTNSIKFNEYVHTDFSDFVKPYIERGYIDLIDEDGVLTHRIELPKDWKPRIEPFIEFDYIPKESFQKRKKFSFKTWFSSHWVLLLSLTSFLLGICGLLLALI